MILNRVLCASLRHQDWCYAGSDWPMVQLLLARLHIV